MSTMDARRAEWRDLFGAHRPPDAGWTVSNREVIDTGERIDLRLHAFGADLETVLLLPHTASDRPSPVVVVPFYDVESLLGLPSELYPEPDVHPTKAFAREVAQSGLAALAVPWWAEIATSPNTIVDLDGRYGPVAQAHLERFPEVTGLGRSVVELSLAVDALESIDGIDAGAIGVLGHSLGGKLALCTAALDERFAAVFAHEPGLGFAHSNWSDLWYLGDRMPRDRDLDELITLIAPRPLLYAGGGAFDGPQNADLIDRSRHAWPELGLTVHMHDQGHPLPEEVLRTGIRWLAKHLGCA